MQADRRVIFGFICGRPATIPDRTRFGVDSSHLYDYYRRVSEEETREETRHDETNESEPSSRSWMFVLAEHTAPMSAEGIKLQRQLATHFGARKFEDFLHLTIQKFRYLTDKRLETVWREISDQVSRLKPFDVRAETAFPLTSEFRRYDILKLVVSYDDSAEAAFTEGIPDVLRANGIEPLYRYPAKYLTFIENLSNSAKRLADMTPAGERLFTADRISLSEYRPATGFAVLKTVRLEGDDRAQHT